MLASRKRLSGTSSQKILKCTARQKCEDEEGENEEGFDTAGTTGFNFGSGSI
jgi:hypothetical protein